MGGGGRAGETPLVVVGDTTAFPNSLPRSLRPLTVPALSFITQIIFRSSVHLNVYLNISLHEMASRKRSAAGAKYSTSRSQLRTVSTLHAAPGQQCRYNSPHSFSAVCGVSPGSPEAPPRDTQCRAHQENDMGTLLLRQSASPPRVPSINITSWTLIKLVTQRAQTPRHDLEYSQNTLLSALRELHFGSFFFIRLSDPRWSLSSVKKNEKRNSSPSARSPSSLRQTDRQTQEYRIITVINPFLSASESTQKK